MSEGVVRRATGRLPRDAYTRHAGGEAAFQAIAAAPGIGWLSVFGAAFGERPAPAPATAFDPGVSQDLQAPDARLSRRPGRSPRIGETPALLFGVSASTREIAGFVPTDPADRNASRIPGAAIRWVSGEIEPHCGRGRSRWLAGGGACCR